MWGQTKKLAMGIAFATSLAGCAGQSAMSYAPGNAFSGVASNEATILVTNYNWSDMAVYAERMGTQVRLGTVMSMGREQFRLPPGMVGTTDLHIIADPLGGRTIHRTRPVLVIPGQKVDFRIENNLDLSTVSVW